MSTKKAAEAGSGDESDDAGSEWGSSTDESNASNGESDDEVVAPAIIINGEEVETTSCQPVDNMFVVAVECSAEPYWATASKKEGDGGVLQLLSAAQCEKVARAKGAKLPQGGVVTMGDRTRFKVTCGLALPRQLQPAAIETIKIGKLSGKVVPHKGFPKGGQSTKVFENNNKHYYVQAKKEGKGYEMIPVKTVRQWFDGMGEICAGKMKEVDKACIARFGVKCAGQVHNAISRQAKAAVKRKLGDGTDESSDRATKRGKQQCLGATAAKDEKRANDGEVAGEPEAPLRGVDAGGKDGDGPPRSAKSVEAAGGGGARVSVTWTGTMAELRARDFTAFE